MDIPELRHEKDHYFGHAHDSPLTVEQRDHFDGLRYFPEDEAFRFVVTVDPEGAGALHEQLHGFRALKFYERVPLVCRG